MMKLQGRGILVSGGSSGIGKAVAVRLAREGARLFVGGAPADATDVQGTVEELCALGVDAAGTIVDVADSAGVSAFVDAALTHLGTLNVLVSNAGTYWPESFLEITEEHWDRMLAVNRKARFLLG